MLNVIYVLKTCMLIMVSTSEVPPPPKKEIPLLPWKVGVN